MNELNCKFSLYKKRFLTYKLEGHDNFLTALDIKDGLVVSGGKDSTVRIWSTEKKKCLLKG